MKTKTIKTTPMEARVMWAYEGTLAGRDVVLSESKTPHCTTPAHPVLVLDWSDAGQVALEVKIAMSIAEVITGRWQNYPLYALSARASIAALAPAKRKRKTT